MVKPSSLEGRSNFWKAEREATLSQPGGMEILLSRTGAWKLQMQLKKVDAEHARWLNLGMDAISIQVADKSEEQLFRIRITQSAYDKAAAALDRLMDE